MKNLALVILIIVAAGCLSPRSSRNLADRKVREVFFDLLQTNSSPAPSYVISYQPMGGNSVQIISGPEDRINEVGTHADFTVLATSTGTPITYQWYKLTGITNRYAILHATNNVLCIEGVQSSDVAGYEVVISQGGTEVTNRVASLSVQTIACTASVQGLVESPITAFGSQTWTCPAGGTFSKAYSPFSNGRPVLFYGKNVPLSYQFGDAINTAFYSNLTISTHNPTNNAANSPADTGLRLENNGNNASPPVTRLDICTDVATPVWPNDTLAAKIGLYPMSASTDRNIAAYKLTIYYKGTPPSSGKIFWTWLYEQ